MKKNLLSSILFIAVLFSYNSNYSQAPNLGTAADFVLFSSVGAVTNTGISQLTGNVGTNNGSSTGFGNVNGVMHDGDGATAQCTADLTLAYNQLNSTIPNFFPAPLLGNGQILTAGVYSIGSAATFNGNLTLNAQGNENAVFIIKIQGAFASGANAAVLLTNGAQACNVFWKIEGLVSLASGTSFKGTLIAHNAAINLNTGVILEGRALSTTGAVMVNGVLSFTPIGCGSPVLNGPIAPSLGAATCFTIFSSNGSVSNSGVTTVTGDVGTNVGLTTGFSSLSVNGMIHTIPDVSTAQAAASLLLTNTYLTNLPKDIELLYPAQFGRDLVLTPHTYLLNAATVLTGSVYLDAQNNSDAVFVIKINGALSTDTYSKVILINGTQAKNVYWKINGAVLLRDYTEFEGTIVANNGAVNLTTGTILNGRAFTTAGALGTVAIVAILPEACALATQTFESSQKAMIYPNPFQSTTTITLHDNFNFNETKIIIYNSYGAEVVQSSLSETTTTIEMSNFPSGFYFYTISSQNKIIQSGKLISK